MKSLLCNSVLLLLFAVPVFAQGNDVAIWGSWAQFNSQNIADPDFDVELEFEDATGFGISANWFWTDRFSTELMAIALDSDAQINISAPGEPGVALSLGSLDVTPIMLTAQFHLSPDGAIDPYIGVGAAYVLLGDLQPDPLVEAPPVELEDEVTFLVNAGLQFSITPNFGIILDARYMPLQAEPEDDEEGDEELEEEEEVDLDPIIVSLGLRWRFGGR